MPGKRATEQADFVTPRVVYRDGIDTIDTDVLDTTIPILDTNLPPSIVVGLGQADVNQYGRNAQIDLAILLGSATGSSSSGGSFSVTLELWLKAEIEGERLRSKDSLSPSSSSSSSPRPLPATEDWVFVATQTFTRSTLWVVKDIPPGKYKVLATAVSGRTTILEQHAA